VVLSGVLSVRTGRRAPHLAAAGYFLAAAGRRCRMVDALRFEWLLCIVECMAWGPPTGAARC